MSPGKRHAVSHSSRSRARRALCYRRLSEHPPTQPSPRRKSPHSLAVAAGSPQRITSSPPQGEETQRAALETLSLALQQKRPVNVKLINYRKATPAPHHPPLSRRRTTPLHFPSLPLSHFPTRVPAPLASASLPSPPPTHPSPARRPTLPCSSPCWQDGTPFLNSLHVAPVKGGSHFYGRFITAQPITDGSVAPREETPELNPVPEAPVSYVGKGGGRCQRRVSQAQLADMLESEDPYVLCSSEWPHVITHASPAWCEMCGYMAEEVEGLTNKILTGPDTDSEAPASLLAARVTPPWALRSASLVASRRRSPRCSRTCAPRSRPCRRCGTTRRAASASSTRRRCCLSATVHS